MDATIWSLFPAVVAIILALITKEVYISLLVGILGGAMFYTGFQVIPSMKAVLTIMSDKVGGNLNILIFLILLGMLVSLMQKSGASAAYGRFASSKIKGKRGALALTSLLGVLIFVDDYFNCLTVGTVMRPVTDKHRISRAKLAYIIDATAAPVCIISPISSWAAAVGSSLPEGSGIDGFTLFLRSIPYNIYAIVTLIMVFALIAMNFDYGKMKKYESLHEADIDKLEQAENMVNASEAKSEDKVAELSSVEQTVTKQGGMIDLVLPIAMLIVLCIFFMLYTGGIFQAESIINSFANSDASFSLVLGSFFTLILTALLYLPRKIMKFSEYTDSLVQGFKAMVPAILILVLAWTLSGISGAGYLESGIYVSNVISNSNMSLALIPAVFFVTALGLAFATGTSWGTFGILIPIIVPVLSETSGELLPIAIAAALAGAVCGDHISPISDTTILSSAGADCNHIEHVSTQIPYALTVAIPAFIGYLVSGFTENGYLGLLVTTVIVLAVLFLLRNREKASK